MNEMTPGQKRRRRSALTRRKLWQRTRWQQWEEDYDVGDDYRGDMKREECKSELEEDNPELEVTTWKVRA